MFSSRLPPLQTANRITQRIEALRQAHVSLLDLTLSNPTQAGLRYPEGELLAALQNPRALRYEPTAAGAWEAREAVAAYYAARDLHVPPDNILLTASTSEAYAYLFKLLTEPGDEVLVPAPSYPLFEYLCALEAVRAVAYPLVYDGAWHIDMQRLRAQWSHRTKAVLLVNPNNPTGSFLHQDERQVLTRWCAEQGCALVSDEVFADYVHLPHPRQVRSLVDEQAALTFCLSGLSKVVGLPQVKLGWIVLNGPPALRQQAWHGLEWIADAFLSVSAPVQLAAPVFLRAGASIRQQILERVQRNLRRLAEAVSQLSFMTLLRVEAGWYAILRVPRVRSDEEWVLLLLEQAQVLVQPGFFYDFAQEGYLILSLLPEPAVFDEALQRITGVLPQAIR